MPEQHTSQPDAGRTELEQEQRCTVCRPKVATAGKQAEVHGWSKF